MNENWNALVSLFPSRWRELAHETNALKGLRKDKSAENLLHTLLLHLGCGYSLRETVVRAREANLADMSDVALLKRLRKSKDWLAALCQTMFEDRGIKIDNPTNLEVRLFDATTIKEPGKTGSLWRIHYSLRMPALRCDFLRITPSKGKGNGESLSQFDCQPGEHIIGDRGYGRVPGIEYIHNCQASVLIRITPHNISILDTTKSPFPWQEELSSIKTAGTIKSWDVFIAGTNGNYIPGRICAIRKTDQAIKESYKRLKDRAARKMQKIQPLSFLYAKYVIVFTTFSKKRFSDADVLNWYRLRWQVELVFKRFKQLAKIGHLPKYTDESSEAWLYGKLFVALMIEKLIWYANTFSPWGYIITESFK